MKHSTIGVVSSFIAFIAFCFFLVPGTASAQVTGTVGLSTGLQELGHSDTLLVPVAPTINWGDGSANTSAELDCKRLSVTDIRCNFWGEHTYTHATTYPIKVTYNGFSSFSTTAKIDPVGNFVIVSVGDSVASGEGNPVVYANHDLLHPHNAYWDLDTKTCPDRSSRAGPVLAAHLLQEENPGTHVTIDHLACSGAELHQAQAQINNMGLPSGQKVDALLMTVGADSVYGGGFSAIVEKCLNPLPGYDCSQDPTFAADLATGIADLTYSGIESAVKSHNIADTYITEYFDPTHDAYGNFPNKAETKVCTLGLAKADEWPFLYNHMVLPLNEKVQDAAQEYGWHYVGGNEFGSEADEASVYSDNEPANEPDYNGPYFPIASLFTYSAGGGHGYCVGGLLPGSSWVVSAPQSLKIEDKISGTSHPNPLGQREYARRLVQAINYYTPPESAATATTNGQPYMFGTWTTHDVDVTLSATNKLASAGVGHSYFAEDDPTCSDTNPQSCIEYQGPLIMDQSGKHTLTFFSSNKKGTFEKEQTEQVWIDNKPPVMACTATPSMLWPPNNKLVPVSLNVTAVSAAFGPTPIILTSVTTSEGNPQTDIQGFVIGQPSTTGLLLASRTGNQRAGRIYTFTYQSTDPLGLTATCTTTVTAPHDQRRR